MTKGKFITFEGGEGSGKTTQLKLLHAKLQELGYDMAEITKEPGSRHLEFTKEMRDILLFRDFFPEGVNNLAGLALYFADRAYHVAKFIRPNLEAGKTVICDRHSGSTFVYQSLVFNVLPLDQIKEINYAFTGGLCPDLTFFIDVPAEEAMERLKKPRDQRVAVHDIMPQDFHEKLRNGFIQLSETEPNWIRIDGMGSVEQVEERVWEAMQKFLGK
ncbi:MAG: dTMP kinase [Patescibacteria group bacterium]|nr:dTMP kinase [Patescibacteria group bacterium]